MRKTSVVLGATGLALLAWSFMPSVGAPATGQTTAAHGKAVFQAKGCAACHAHAAINHAGFETGPSLTNYRADPAYLQRWLRNPQAIKPNAAMPNLNLSDDEITALIAFLSNNQ